VGDISVPTHNLSAQDLSPKEGEQPMLERRAVDAVIWGMPIVSVDAMRQSLFSRWKGKLWGHHLVAEGERLEKPVAHSQYKPSLSLYLLEH
jgi:hypothetical protein